MRMVDPYNLSDRVERSERSLGFRFREPSVGNAKLGRKSKRLNPAAPYACHAIEIDLAPIGEDFGVEAVAGGAVGKGRADRKLIEIPADARDCSSPHLSDEQIGRGLEPVGQQKTGFTGRTAYEPVSSFFGQFPQPEVTVGRPLATSIRPASS